jgi:hypothetical protein
MGTRDEIVRVLGHSNVCIPTSRVIQSVLGHFGFESYPVPTEVGACNKVQAEIFKSIGGREQAANATSELRKIWARKGAWSTAIGPGIAEAGLPVRTDGWDGHLVLRVEDILLDGSIAMLNDLAKDLSPPKLLWTPVDPEWDRGIGCAGVTLTNGCEVVYGKLSDDSWRGAPYWKADREPYKSLQSKMVEAILARVKQQSGPVTVKSGVPQLPLIVLEELAAFGDEQLLLFGPSAFVPQLSKTSITCEQVNVSRIVDLAVRSAELFCWICEATE